jgi:RNA polymerase sigma factor (sigma-70 family)
MKDWQKDRNYRKFENEDGSFTFVVTVDSTDVEVSEEVYLAYSQSDRRERYIEERESGLLLSLDGMDEADGMLSYITDGAAESAEDTALQRILYRQLEASLHLLDDEDRELIQRLYFDGISIRKYAKEKGLSDFAIRHRERKALAKIKKLLES